MDTTYSYLEKLLTRIAFLGVLLLPVVFLPGASVNLYVVKITFLATIAAVLFITFLFTVLKTGHLRVPKSRALLLLALLALVGLASALMTGLFGPSFSGVVLEQGSAVVFLILTVLASLFAFGITTSSMAETVLRAFLYSSFVLVVLLLITILSSYGILPSALTSYLPAIPAGSVTDTGIILGAAVLLALSRLTMSSNSSRMRYLLYVLLVASFLFIGAMNFRLVPTALAVFTLLHFVYLLSFSGAPTMDGMPRERKVSPISLFVLAASVVLLIGASSIGSTLSSTLRVNNVLVRPSGDATFGLLKKSVQESPALGIGPNRFANFWDMNRPTEINLTNFWSTRFSSGSGYLPTLAIETGILGLLAILGFLAIYMLTAFKAIFSDNQAGESSGNNRFLALTSFLLAIYFWVMLIFYSPGIVVLALAFVMTGLSIAIGVNNHTIRSTTWNIFASQIKFCISLWYRSVGSSICCCIVHGLGEVYRGCALYQGCKRDQYIWQCRPVS